MQPGAAFLSCGMLRAFLNVVKQSWIHEALWFEVSSTEMSLLFSAESREAVTSVPWNREGLWEDGTGLAGLAGTSCPVSTPSPPAPCL